VIAMTPNPVVTRRLSLAWGVEAIVIDDYHSFEALIAIVEARMLCENLARPDERIAIISRAPGGQGGTNVMNVRRLALPTPCNFAATT
jgi:pyruvate kinase